jgi:hypothetical protein
MLNPTSLVLYICASVSLVIMADAVDSSSHLQSDTFIDPGQDLELEHMDDSYTQVTSNVSVPCERRL